MPLGSAVTSKIDIDFTRAQGVNSSGRITFEPNRTRVGTTIISTSRVPVEIVNGVGSVDLVRLPAGLYKVREEIDGRPPYEFMFALPLSASPVINYEDIAPVSSIPANYTVVRSVNGQLPNPTTGNVEVEVGEGGGGVTDHGALTGLGDDDHTQYHNNTRGDIRYYTKAQIEDLLDGIEAGTGLKYPVDGKVFCPDDYGAVGNGATDDHAAVLACWQAAWTWLQAAPTEQEPYRDECTFYVPFGKHYRVDTSNGSRLLTTGQARAILVVPFISRTASNKKTLRIMGAGEHYVVRAPELAGTPRQVNPPCSLFFDSGATVHTWSNTLGLPCAIGATDADMTDFEGNTFSNVHVTIQDLTIRQNDDPSLCAVNLEQISTARIERVRIDVETVLDAAPLCTHKTGASILLPRSNNNVAISADKLVVEGHYTGIPMTEHLSFGDGIALRCTIGLANRRPNSHHSYMKMLKIEQCPYGLTGYDPANDGVRTAFGWSGEIAFLDFEDYAYNGEFPEIYAPIYPGTHFWDADNVVTALVKMDRVNSEQAPPTGVGVAPFNETNSAYVRGAANKLSLWNRKMETAVERKSNDPIPPSDDVMFFEGVDGPGIDNDNGTAICLGLEFRITATGKAKGLRYWRATANMPNNATGRIYKVSDQGAVTGTDVTFAAGSSTGWIEALFSSPVSLVVGDRYIALVRMPNGRYAATGGYFDSGAGSTGRTVGILRAENFSDYTPPTPGQGSFVEGALAFPTHNGNGANYWVDVIAQPD